MPQTITLAELLARDDIKGRVLDAGGDFAQRGVVDHIFVEEPDQVRFHMMWYEFSPKDTDQWSGPINNQPALLSFSSSQPVWHLITLEGGPSDIIRIQMQLGNIDLHLPETREALEVLNR